ncbi:MAG: GNAT family N-acetyltransferase [Defluviitaleaceae bacterium]|nr:GNAT family N-acetyltransferase [Defluviitaleaceae bacterium]
MDYRKAEINDIKTLVAFRKQQLLDEGEVPKKNIDSELTRYFEKFLTEESLIQYVAMDGSEIVATGGVHFYLYPPSYSNPTGKTAYIASMYTLPAYRGKGIATAILRILIDEVRARSYKRIRLFASNQGRPVYEKLGFKDTPGFMKIDL